MLHSPLHGLTLARIVLPVGLLILLGLAAMFNEPGLFLSINRACAHLPDTVWVSLSLLGNGWVIAALLLPLVTRYPQLFFAALMTAPWTGLVANVAKTIFSTPRPPSVLEVGSFNLIGEMHLSASMPSGHTITAFAVAVALTRMPNSPFSKHTIAVYGLAALVGLSRMGMGVHWPEDVLIGAAIGWLSGLLACEMAYRWFPERWLALPESGFEHVQGQGARAALTWAIIGLLPAVALFTLDEDRGLVPELRYALATLALICSLNMLYKAWQRR